MVPFSMTLIDLIPDFNVTWYLASNNTKMIQVDLYLQWQTKSKSYMICGTVPFSTTLNNQFQVHDTI